MTKRTNDNLAGWLTKLKAAEILGRSPKAVERMGVRGELQKHLVRREQDGAQIALYNPQDVERKRRALHPDAQPFVLPKDGAALPVLASRAPAVLPPEVAQALIGLGQSMMSIAESVKPRPQIEAPQGRPARMGTLVPLHQRVMLTVRESAAYVGVGQIDIRQEIERGKLRDAVYRTSRGGIRIRREALDKL